MLLRAGLFFPAFSRKFETIFGRPMSHFEGVNGMKIRHVKNGVFTLIENENLADTLNAPEEGFY